MIYGAPGCGKTFLIIDMIMSLCTGSRWANRFDVQRPLYVAYCAGEGLGGLPPRFSSIAKHHSIKTRGYHISTPPEAIEKHILPSCHLIHSPWVFSAVSRKASYQSNYKQDKESCRKLMELPADGTSTFGKQRRYAP